MPNCCAAGLAFIEYSSHFEPNLEPAPVAAREGPGPLGARPPGATGFAGPTAWPGPAPIPVLAAQSVTRPMRMRLELISTPYSRPQPARRLASLHPGHGVYYAARTGGIDGQSRPGSSRWPAALTIITFRSRVQCNRILGVVNIHSLPCSCSAPCVAFTSLQTGLVFDMKHHCLQLPSTVSAQHIFGNTALTGLHA